jgi:photosystem II stability/assembly factor-like uncharacterized protein
MRRSRTICIVIALWLFLLSAIAYAEITWTTKRLTWTDGPSQHPAITVDGSSIYVAYDEGWSGNSEIYLKQSDDGGLTWARKRLSWMPGTSEYPAVAVEGSNIYVVWGDAADYPDYEIKLKQSDDGGISWVHQGLTWRDSYSMTPDVAVNGPNIYVVWQESTLSHSQWSIYLKQSTDGGATWTATRLSDWGPIGSPPKIAVDGQNIYVVWRDRFRKSTDGGVTWEEEKEIGRAGGFGSEPAIVVSGQNIYVVGSGYVQGGNYDIFLLKSTDGGATWETEKRLSYTASDSHKPAIAVTGQDIFVVWKEEKLHNNSEIYFTQSSDGGVTWETEKRLTWNAYNSYDPKIAVNGSNIYVVWEDITPGNSEIFFKKGVLY